MKKRLVTLMAAMASSFSFALIFGSDSRAVDIFVLTNDQPSTKASSPTNFGRIDTTTGTFTPINNFASDVWNLSWNPSANQFFVTEGLGINSTLRTLTVDGVLSSSLGTIGESIYGMAYRTTDSTIYAFGYDSDSTVTINPVNGSLTTLNANPGEYSGAPVGGRYSIMNDTIYFAQYFNAPGFGTMGYTATSTYQPIVADIAFGTMVLANDGTTMYGILGNGTAGQQRLYTIDVNTGVATAGAFITGTGLGTYFHGAAILPVPEPSTYALGAIATGVMAYIARRRKARRA